MKWNIVTFADEKFYSRQKYLEKHAESLGMTLFSYTHDWLKEQNFYKENENILSDATGLGYFCWKPFIILDAINKMNEGELLFYSDVGDMFHSDLIPYVENTIEDDPCLLVLGEDKNKNWTRRDCFVYMNCDEEDYWETKQLEGGISFWKVCDQSKEIITEWLNYCCDRRIISDDPNVSGKENFSTFKNHRWDQSVLTNIAVRRGLSVSGWEIRNFIECNYDYWFERNKTFGFSLGRPIDSLLFSVKEEIYA